jgi:hypothetical protein
MARIREFRTPADFWLGMVEPDFADCQANKADLRAALHTAISLFQEAARRRRRSMERRLSGDFASGVRIPEKATTLSGAWRPRDPVDDDQGGARA